jgi:peptide/nickel transport system ATP-binding protein
MLEIRDLKVTIGPFTIVDIERLTLPHGGRLGIVGESGSGKTMTTMSIIGLQPSEAVVTGSIRFNGRELVGLTDRQLSTVRGREIGVIFQDPAKALNPMMRIGRQVSEAIRLHMDLHGKRLRERVVDLLTQVQLDDAQSLLRRYPHQLSGGQQQRVIIAMAIACDPKLLIADEPTTSLDVTVQNGILSLIRELSASRNMSLIFVTHNLGVIQSISDAIAVIYGGQMVEFGPTDQVINKPFHQYTQALISADPGIADDEHLDEVINQRLNTIRGSVPSLDKFPSGCRFRGRCVAETARCVQSPVTEELAGHLFKCWNPTRSVAQARGVADVAR